AAATAATAEQARSMPLKATARGLEMNMVAPEIWSAARRRLPLRNGRRPADPHLVLEISSKRSRSVRRLLRRSDAPGPVRRAPHGPVEPSRQGQGDLLPAVIAE